MFNVFALFIMGISEVAIIPQRGLYSPFAIKAKTAFSSVSNSKLLFWGLKKKNNNKKKLNEIGFTSGNQMEKIACFIQLIHVLQIIFQSSEEKFEKPTYRPYRTPSIFLILLW